MFTEILIIFKVITYMLRPPDTKTRSQRSILSCSPAVITALTSTTTCMEQISATFASMLFLVLTFTDLKNGTVTMATIGYTRR